MNSRFCIVLNENAKWGLWGTKRGVVLRLPIRIVGVVGGQTPPHIVPWLNAISPTGGANYPTDYRRLERLDN